MQNEVANLDADYYQLECPQVTPLPTYRHERCEEQIDRLNTILRHVVDNYAIEINISQSNDTEKNKLITLEDEISFEVPSTDIPSTMKSAWSKAFTFDDAWVVDRIQDQVLMKFEDYRSHAMRKNEQSESDTVQEDGKGAPIVCTFKDLDMLRKLLNDMIENEQRAGEFPKLGLTFEVVDDIPEITITDEIKPWVNSTIEWIYSKDLQLAQQIDWGMHEASGQQLRDMELEIDRLTRDLTNASYNLRKYENSDLLIAEKKVLEIKLRQAEEEIYKVKNRKRLIRDSYEQQTIENSETANQVPLGNYFGKPQVKKSMKDVQISHQRYASQNQSALSFLLGRQSATDVLNSANSSVDYSLQDLQENGANSKRIREDLHIERASYQYTSPIKKLNDIQRDMNEVKRKLQLPLDI